ncbi:MAG: DUF4347 domain-containing protein, partial [Magnetococcales bacterium]|nr:DUF4347 domain-containing protein [Magnetococcales bacterium]
MSTLIFIDSSLNNFQSLVYSLPADQEVILLDPKQDGLWQMAAALSGRSGLDAIHLFSHGSPGSLQLGSLTLNSANLANHTAALSTIGSALSDDADILLYGCDVAAGDDGLAFINALATATGADVAASDDVTGAARLGGDWDLEVQSGAVSAAFLTPDYDGVLPNSSIQRVSISSDGTQGNGDSYSTSISADGRYVAFYSAASNLVSGDTNGLFDVFVYDTTLNQTSCISLSVNGYNKYSGSSGPSISADGRFVAFGVGYATGSNMAQSAVLIHDRSLNQTTSISGGNSFGGRVSADGRYVAFNNGQDVFIGSTLVSNGTSFLTSISPDGRFVAFWSLASNRVAGDTNDTWDAFVYDTTLGQTSRISVASSGAQGNGPSWNPYLSADGRFVAFHSDATNLVSGDTNGVSDVFIRDSATGITSRVSVSSAGTQSNGGSNGASISADGRFVTFISSASNLVSGDTNGAADVFIYNTVTKQTEIISVSASGIPGNGGSSSAVISADGRFVVLSSSASNLVSGDSNNSSDVFIVALSGVSVTPYNLDLADADDNGVNSDNVTDRISGLTISGNGGMSGSTLVLFDDRDNDWSIDSGEALVTTSVTGASWSADVSLAIGMHAIRATQTDSTGNSSAASAALNLDIVAGGVSSQISIQRVSVASDGTQGNGPSDVPRITADGRFVVFCSNANNLVSGDTNDALDVFVHDRVTGTTNRIPAANNNGNFSQPSISADGRYVAFVSDASNLVPSDTNGAGDVFIYDRTNQTTQRVSIASNGTQGNSSSYNAAISADGQFVTFTSAASNLVSGDTNNCPDIFVYDRTKSTTTRVSIASNVVQGNSDSSGPSISADGRYVAFSSYSSIWFSDDANHSPDVFVHDRTTNTISRVSIASNGGWGSSSSYCPSISADGRFVAFMSVANNLVSGDTNVSMDIFVYDRAVGVTSRVSIANGGSQGNGDSYDPSISADGRFVTFRSHASNLVSGDTNGVSDIFVYDRTLKLTSLISASGSGIQGNAASSSPSISADGRFVTFSSGATNLVPGNGNGFADVFVVALGGDTTPTALDLATSDDTGASNSDNLTSQTSALTISGGGGVAGNKLVLFDDKDSDWIVDSGEALTTANVTAAVWSADISLAAGTHNIRAIQTDVAGNSSIASVVLTLVIDTTAPTIPISLDLAAADDNGDYSSDNITSQASALTVSGSGGEAGGTLILFDDKDYDDAIDTGEALATTNVTAVTWNADISLAVGVHAIKATQIDVAGNSSAASSALTIVTQSTNTAPTVGNVNKAGNEDAAVTFAATTDFSTKFSDPDSDALAKVKITSLPSNGTLRLSGTTVTLDQEIIASNLSNLSYAPTANWNGSDSFGWNGYDGTVYAGSAATVT